MIYKATKFCLKSQVVSNAAERNTSHLIVTGLPEHLPVNRGLNFNHYHDYSIVYFKMQNISLPHTIGNSNLHRIVLINLKSLANRITH